MGRTQVTSMHAIGGDAALAPVPPLFPRKLRNWATAGPARSWAGCGGRTDAGAPQAVGQGRPT